MTIAIQSAIATAAGIARNPYATAHVNAAHARLIAFLIENPPPAFTLHPTPDQFEDCAQLVCDFASMADNWLWQIAFEANSNARSHIGASDLASDLLFSDALHDSSFAEELEREADALREDALEEVGV